VHRLDKDTSGLLVVAKDDATMVALGADFKIHRVRRVYDALVVGRPAPAAARSIPCMARDPHDRKRFTTRVKTGRRAITNWTVGGGFGPGPRACRPSWKPGAPTRCGSIWRHSAVPLGRRQLWPIAARTDVRSIGRTLGRQALHARVLGFFIPRPARGWNFSRSHPRTLWRRLDSLRALAAEDRAKAEARDETLSWRRG